MKGAPVAPFFVPGMDGVPADSFAGQRKHRAVRPESATVRRRQCGARG